ncbi:MAG: dTDP-glucose 4,6-dehydratase [Negativicutes bacterium]|nr:dTDP-glucose 4,6-dehydratase [Negativicutes bacterium]
MRCLVTGGAGFIGANFVRYLLETVDKAKVTNIDLLTYAGNLQNLAGVANHPRYRFVRADIADRAAMENVFAEFRPTHVVNFAAESHVDRSIENPDIFVRTNVVGTQVLLDMAQQFSVEKFVQVSTDEVYGSLGPTGYFREDTPLAANSPYSASKAGADLMVRAYGETFGLPVNITRCSNNYGPYQFPEKLIPLMITNALENKPLPVYGDGLNVRDWLHVADHCVAVVKVMLEARPGEVYNIGGNNERTNIEIVRTVLSLLGKSESLITYVKDRPGHDRRYAIDAGKIAADLGWQPSYTFERGIAETVQWYCDNRQWWQEIKSGEYQEYYRRMYGVGGVKRGGPSG